MTRLFDSMTRDEAKQIIQREGYTTKIIDGVLYFGVPAGKNLMNTFDRMHKKLQRLGYAGSLGARFDDGFGDLVHLGVDR